MFAFAVRLRRKKQPEKEVVKKSTTSVGVYVGVGFLLLFFGSLFLFFELVGHCNCSGDIVGYLMVIIGSFLVVFYCIKDLIQTIKDEIFSEDDEDAEEDANQDEKDTNIGVNNNNDDVSNLSMISFNVSKDISNGYNNIFNPVLISKQVDEINEAIKLDNMKDVKIIPCLPKIPSNVLNMDYDLPTVIVDT